MDTLPPPAPYQVGRKPINWRYIAFAIFVVFAVFQLFIKTTPVSPQNIPEYARKPADKIFFQAKQGDAESQFLVGRYYMHQNQPKLALRWFELAAAQGHYKALNNAGMYYLDGNGVPRDVVKGCDLMRRSHEKVQSSTSRANMQLCEEELKNIKK